MHCTKHRINTWSRKCFRYFKSSLKTSIIWSFSTYCFSKSRIFLFCFSSNFSDFNETQTESKKLFFRISIRFRRAFHIDHALFCFVFHRVFQILMKHRQEIKNHLFYSFINRTCCHCFDYHFIVDRHRRETN